MICWRIKTCGDHSSGCAHICQISRPRSNTFHLESFDEVRHSYDSRLSMNYREGGMLIASAS